jgi:hypothetical protein
VTLRQVSAAALGLLAGLGAAAADTAGNTDELTRVLREARPPAVLRPLQAEQGCGPAGCAVTLGGLSIDTDAGTLRRAGGRVLPWAVSGPVPVAELPEVNWEPLRGVEVRRAGRAWGKCLEFGHTGLGNSGRSQRWRTVVLVAQGGRQAHRFTGYWASCDALAQGARPGEVSLPLVEPVQAGAPALQVVWMRCDAKRCVRELDARQVEGSASSEDGRLSFR